MSSPVGTTIGKPTKPWTIGRLLGSGACGSVHELTPPPQNSSSSSNMEYAIKLVHLPPTTTKTTNKKRKKTAVERNADLLLHEYTILQNVGSNNRGKIFPDIPLMGVTGGPPGYGETADKKYRYLVMERMSSPLSSIIPLLLNNTTTKASSNKVMKIPLGNIAAALFNCIYEMHMLNYLFQDVKPDNFMLASATNTSSSSATKSSKKTAASSNNNKKNNNGEKDLANRIRLLDFGLVERYSDISSSSHREDLYPTSSIVGTPTYVSCNVMGGHTPSRRDDLESLGYVICELILLLVGGDSNGGGSGSVGGGRKRKGAATGAAANNNVLPWSNAKSDKELYQIKQQEMDKSKRSSSVLFTQLKRCGGGLDDIIGKYFDEVMSLEYAEKPNYDRLCDHLKKIVVTLSSSSLVGVGGGEVEDDGGGKVAAASTKKKSATAKGTAAAAAVSSPKKKPATKKSASTAAAATTATATSPRRNPSRRNKGKQPPPSSSESDSSVASENIENCKKQKVGTTTTRTRKKSSRTIATQTDDDDDMICIDTSSDEEVEVVEEEEGVQEMDWELVDNDDDDNIAAPAAAAAAASTQKNAFLKLEVISGPQKGQEVSFGNDYPDTVVVGRDPDSTSSRGLKDAAKLALTVSSSIHAKFVITSKKNLHSVRVTDMPSSSSSSSDEVTLVNGAVLASGKSRQAFIGDKITVGRSILQVKRATA